MTDDVIVVDAVAYLVCANHMLRLGYDSVREAKDLVVGDVICIKYFISF